MVELFLHNWNLSSKLRVPAISRLQKVHNVELALSALKESGLELSSTIQPPDIVDGHREKTLELLWTILLKSQFEAVPNMEAFAADSNMSTDAAPPYPWSGTLAEVHQPASLQHDTLVQVHNFTVSLCDGRVLCYILHYYQPDLLPRSAIRELTTLTCPMDTVPGWYPILCVSHFCAIAGVVVDKKELTVLLANERENLRLFLDKAQELGGVPLVTQPGDVSNTIPDERVMITLLVYLNTRLLNLSREIRAARLIQTFWRTHYVKAGMASLQAKTLAAIIIQRRVRQFLERRREQRRQAAALILQKIWRGYCVRRFLKQQKASITIQAFYRGYRARKLLRLKIAAIVKIQAFYRGWRERQRYHHQRQAIIQLQRWYRAYSQRKVFLQIRESIIKIQTAYRCHQAKTELSLLKTAKFLEFRQNCAATKIQNPFKCYKCYLAKKELMRLKDAKHLEIKQNCAATKIQSLFRGYQARKIYVTLRAARELWIKQNASATKIQAFYWCYKARQNYLAMKRAVIIIQQRFKAKMAGRAQRRLYQQQLEERRAFHQQQRELAIIVIQTRLRAYLKGREERRRFLQMKTAAITIQAWYRGAVQRNKYLRWRSSLLAFQQACRQHLLARKLLNIYLASSKIKAFLKMSHERQSFLKLRESCILIQRTWRARAERKKFLALRQATILVQRRWRERRPKADVTFVISGQEEQNYTSE
ncbi:ASPM, partial [Cordylochernes scorpioides]